MGAAGRKTEIQRTRAVFNFAYPEKDAAFYEKGMA